VANEAAGGTRWIEVAPDRLAGWLESFAQRHGDVTGAGDRAVVTFRAADGSVAECHVPFPPLPSPASGAGGGADGAPAADQVGACAARIAAHVQAERTVGVLLVRLGGYAAGVFTGPAAAHLAASKVGSRLVHGRSAAGGQSQQRFARRREKQAGEALGAAADVAAAVFGPYRDQLDAVVLGGDRRTIAGLRDDPRLRPYVKLAVERFLTVPDPRLAVLRTAPRLFQAIRIRLTEPPRAGGGREN
jgi:Actinobacteria/chloroflexi VLRF1 release factor